jgi:DDE superfamily endonuclease
LILAVFFHAHQTSQQINVQTTVDHEGYFTSYDIGWPASQVDITIFKKSSLWLQHHAYFHPDEYLLADKGTYSYSEILYLLIAFIGYTITPYTIRPFEETELRTHQEQQQCTHFNKMHSSARIVVEHAFGALKG